MRMSDRIEVVFEGMYTSAVNFLAKTDATADELDSIVFFSDDLSVESQEHARHCYIDTCLELMCKVYGRETVGEDDFIAAFALNLLDRNIPEIMNMPRDVLTEKEEKEKEKAASLCRLRGHALKTITDIRNILENPDYTYDKKLNKIAAWRRFAETIYPEDMINNILSKAGLT